MSTCSRARCAATASRDKPFILLLSDDDRALRLSGLIAGSRPRVGDYKDAADLAAYGVTVVDLSKVKGIGQLQPHQVRRQSRRW